LQPTIRKAAVFEPFKKPARYKGAHGGRGSGKSHEFAGNLVLFHAQTPGARSVCIREVQKSLKESAKYLIESKIEEYGFKGFEFRTDSIKTPGGGLIIFQGMKDHTAESIKSLEGFDRAWVEEAQTLSAKSLELLRPTIRKPGSELWFSWNPRRPSDPVDELLRGPHAPDDAIVIEANWSDNPWFPIELEKERRQSQTNDPDRYRHIWEGDYAKVFEGAYYADGLNLAERERRIAYVSSDRLYQVRCYWDIGGTSRKADATAIWVVQFAGDTIRVLNYYEARGQEFADHVAWLRDQGYEKAVQYLPHDGGRHDAVQRVTPQSFLREAGFQANTLPNTGAGAALKRVEAVRRVLPKCFFNADTTKGGRDALAWYHEKRDEERNIGLGPEHDWSSHGADAFGEMAVDFENRRDDSVHTKPLRRNVGGIA
jgi:phage terminase large subunit